MELSSSLHHSHACASDSEDDHNPLFAKSTTESPPLAHLTERQQLAYVMRESRQQRASTTKQPLKRQSASLPPLHPVSSRAKPLPTAPTTKPLATKPSMLTHDKKRRRTTTAAAIDPDDSHLYIVQRLPPAATAPAPLPAPAEYDGWSVEQRRRWDRVSEQPGLYYYHHTAPGVAQRADGWDEAEVELLQHLLVCHPLADGSRRSEASEWGLFSINLPGRVGAECERKWRELKAAGRVWSEDRFDYMRWCEQQRQRSANRAQVDVATAVAAQPAAAAAQRQPTSATPPAVLGRKRVGAPTAELPSELKQAKQEVEAIAQPPAQEAAAVIQPKAEVRGGVKAEARASAMQPTAVHARPQRQDRDRTESREQPPRKKTVRFQPTPPPATKTAPTPSPPVQTTPQAAVPSSIAAAPTALPTTTVAARRPPPLRVAILAQSAAPAADDGTTSALWPPRPPRMPLCASIVPSTITPRRTAVAVDKRIDTTQLTVSTSPHTGNGQHSAVRLTATISHMCVFACWVLGTGLRASPGPRTLSASRSSDTRRPHSAPPRLLAS